VVELAKELKELGFEIISTGGTYNLLKESGVEAVQVSDITGFPEILDGRVKTLHPFVHAGILANRNNPEHVAQLVLFGIEPIDLVVVNLYPFKETVLDENATMGDAIENIDIGGPTLIRAAAKNWESVTVLVDPQDYEQVIDELRDSGSTSLKTRFYLAAKAFRHTAFYDAVIVVTLVKEQGFCSLRKLFCPLKKSKNSGMEKTPTKEALSTKILCQRRA